ncbi:MAG TPA: tetraacyldisaccharide 4'-kinase [Bacteroidia bacterium]|nr:tetraacyldisaccharide 4'-kinase [Bacteroidia bacterium]
MHIRKLLLPFSWLYGIVTGARNFFYDKGILASRQFEVPVICVGNLSTGGTGKTPHVEYIIQLLKNNFVLATLSRGYGRNTTGFVIAKPNMTSEILGDEPAQYALKFPDAIVAVGENRVDAIENLLSEFPGVDAIIMDDGFQHRSVKPGLSILLTDYSLLFSKDFLLPAGDLRENKNGYKRADLIVVTKCPLLSETVKQNIISEISPLNEQQVLFSHLVYDALIPFKNENDEINIHQLKGYEVFLLTGIANPQSLIAFLKEKVSQLHLLKFQDHHDFTKKDLVTVRKKFDNIVAEKKIIITTEKDFTRLKKENLKELVRGLPFYYVPVKVEFDGEDKKIFDKKILSYVGKN